MSNENHIRPVDVVVNVYGKPYQTAVSLWSLMKFSQKHIGKIYVILEKTQPDGFDENLLKRLLVGLPIEYYTPPYFFGWWEGRRKGLINKILLKFKAYRYSIRYQYAWEKSKAPFLFLMHNDMLVFDDLIGHYLTKIGSHVGIGQIGQCWNCPAFQTHCDGNRYWDFRPSAQQMVDLYAGRPDSRANVHGLVGLDQGSWPMPECRLNEHAALIQMSVAKPITCPNGTVQPIGIKNRIDIGISWFNGMSLAGFRMVNESYEPFAKHAWTNGTDCGHASLFDLDQYAREEEVAKQELTKYIKIN
jgi:hypothetical protein